MPVSSSTYTFSVSMRSVRGFVFFDRPLPSPVGVLGSVGVVGVVGVLGVNGTTSPPPKEVPSIKERPRTQNPIEHTGIQASSETRGRSNKL